MATFIREIPDRIKRSEVYFGRRGEEYWNVQTAQKKGLQYYAFSYGETSVVYHADLNRRRVCKVSDLIDDRPPIVFSLQREEADK